MDAQFVDRILICCDCRGEFVFTAGEQLFFHDKQFKNDPKRCKPCKSRRSGLGAPASGSGPAAAGLSRTETRTECSECGVETTVPFKPTQGRPVLCRQCFQSRSKAAARTEPTATTSMSATAAALTSASTEENGESLSADAAAGAAASMAAAPAHSSVASAADLAAIAPSAHPIELVEAAAIPTELLVAAQGEPPTGERAGLSIAAPESSEA